MAALNPRWHGSLAFCLTLLLAIGGLPIAVADQLTTLHDPQAALDHRMELIEAAHSEILLITHVIDNGQAASAIFGALTRRAAEGIRVRVLCDGMMSSVQPEIWQPLIRAGGEIRVYHPLGTLRPITLNYRLHSKVQVTDRQRMLIGSRNLADNHFALAHPVYLDREMIVEGATAAEAGRYFDWLWCSPGFFDIREYPPLANEDKRLMCPTPSPDESVDELSVETDCVRLLHDRDVKKSDRVMARSVWNMVDSAKCSIFIETPYPAFSKQFTDHLIAAARRGVRVVVLTNSLTATDQTIVYAAYQNIKASLLEAGIILLEFPGPNLLHAKTLVVDEQQSLFGSFNFDARSERLNLELDIFSDDPAVAEMLLVTTADRFQRAVRVRSIVPVQFPQLETRQPGERSKAEDLQRSRWLAHLIRKHL